MSCVVALLGAGAAGCSGGDGPEAPSERPGNAGARGCARVRANANADDGRFCASLPGRCPGATQLVPVYSPADRVHQGTSAGLRCNGATYGNACEAAAAGVSIDHAGECERGGELCGGIPGFPCPDGQACIDDPSDDCDPAMGGADCGGVCVDSCGDAICAIGLECCNRVMGICTPPGGVCIQ